MKRTALSAMESWLHQKSRKPLVIRGARQVGKTALVRIFAEQQGLDLIEINLERHLELTKLFAGIDIPGILLELEGMTGKKAVPGKSLLFLDEIQAIPEAIAALRYFYEDRPELAVVAAGSLLEFALAEHSFSMPVGRIEYLHLGPMTFQEYLEATDPYSAEWLDNLVFDWQKQQNDQLSGHLEIPGSIHHRLLKKQREYLFVGGMPEAVSAFCDNQDFHAVSRIHNILIETYIDDFAKYAGQADLARLQTVFRALPLHGGKKVVYARFSREDTSVQIKNALELLLKARISTKVIHAHGNGIPLMAEMDERVFKLIFIDVGLLNRMLGLPPHTLQGMDEVSLTNAGALAEQFVGQNLLQDKEIRSPLFLNYWQRMGKTENAEVDYLLQIDAALYPLEIKAGKTGSLKSLHQFMLEKGGALAVRMDLNPPSIQRVRVKGPAKEDIAYTLLSLPLYLVSRLTDAVRSAAPNTM